MSLQILISAFMRELFLRPEVLVCNGGCGSYRIYVVVVARNARICIDSIGDVVLRQGGIV